MSASHGDSDNSLVSVARAVRARGLKGEVVAELLTDFPERFESIKQLVAIAPNGEQRQVDLEDFWLQNGRIVLKFAGCDNVESAGEFSGYEFCIDETELVPLEDDEYYDFELEGCAVRDREGNLVGSVRSILKTGGTEILVIAAPDDKEVLVPLAESIVVEIDTAGKSIVIDPPEGLLDL